MALLFLNGSYISPLAYLYLDVFVVIPPLSYWMWLGITNWIHPVLVPVVIMPRMAAVSGYHHNAPPELGKIRNKNQGSCTKTEVLVL